MPRKLRTLLGHVALTHPNDRPELTRNLREPYRSWILGR
jgi:hypothetical protein